MMKGRAGDDYYYRDLIRDGGLQHLKENGMNSPARVQARLPSSRFFFFSPWNSTPIAHPFFSKASRFSLLASRRLLLQ